MAAEEGRSGMSPSPLRDEQVDMGLPGLMHSAEIPLQKRLVLEMPEQPDDSTCGPTCLHAVYRYFGDDIKLEQVIAEVAPLETGGTLAVLLGLHALRRGYRATLFTYNLRLFDPTWFAKDAGDLQPRIREQLKAKEDPKFRFASESFLDYLALGGTVRFEELAPTLIRRFLKQDLPILTGLSATYLYGCAREVGDRGLRPDDVRGEPVGHFVVLCGYDVVRRDVLVADPLQVDPDFRTHHYWVRMQRLLGAIMLGVLTYDGNLLILEPPARRDASA